MGYARLVLGLAPNEVLMEISGRAGVELLSEEAGIALYLSDFLSDFPGGGAGLALVGLGVLFFRGQVEDQVGDDECSRFPVKPGDILLAEAGEVDSFNLSSWEHRNQKHEH